MLKDKTILSWCLYDVGNSAFATTIIAVILPIYYQSVTASNLPQDTALSYWGYATSIALLLSALITPILGLFIDTKGAHKRILITFTTLGAIISIAFSLCGLGSWPLVLLLLAAGTVSFSSSQVCYDSLLPHIAPPGKLDAISSTGYALGYLGGGALLALNLLTIHLAGPITGAKLSFVSVGIWWLAFTIPLIQNVPQPQPTQKDQKISPTKILTYFISTWNDLKKHPQAFKFLIAFWFYNDGLGTIMRMAAIFAATIGLNSQSLVGALLITQFVGVPFALFFAKISDKLGSKKALVIAISTYIIITLWAAVLQHNWQFWCLAIGVGMVQGGTQALSRSSFASMLPPDKSGQFFGLYDISSKFAGVIGPALIALLTQLTGSIRIGIAVVAIEFIIGLIILSKVNIEKGRKQILEADHAGA